MWIRFSEEIQVRWVPQGDDTYEFQVLVCALLRSLHFLLRCLLTTHIDDREQSNGDREPSRREGIRNRGFVY